MFNVRLKLGLFLFSFTIYLSSFCLAETRLGLEAFKISPDTELELTAESMTFDSKNGKAHFFDDVVVNYGQLRLSAQNLTFIQTKNSTNFNHLTFSASGPIIISNKNDFIYGDKALYIGQKQELTITGNVSLNQNNNKIVGDKLILDLENGLARISGSVKTIINSTGKN
ncbi:MAG: hypothetical protein CML40_10745 [Rhodobacteraceae bacterium]|nr:MAG: hypothetical protein CML40_10745 [Paracoccaceae bacterium]